MPSSSAIGPRLTDDESPNTLPLVGYNTSQLTDYIFRQLGYPTWNVELTKQQVLDCIQDALGLYSQWCPTTKVGNVQLDRGVHEYLKNVNVYMGIVEVHFVEPNPVPTEIFYGNLINPAPLFRTGLDEYDTFLRWRKVWMRVTSIQPQWFYDDGRKALYIHNPIERFQAGVFMYAPWDSTQDLSLTGALWVKEYSLESSRYLYGEVLAKFSGAIPGPLKDLQLDTQKREKAEARLLALREKLQGMQMAPAITID